MLRRLSSGFVRRVEPSERPLTRSELEEYARDFVAKVVVELREHGELLTLAYLLVHDDLVLVPTFYRTPVEKDVCVVALRRLEERLRPRAAFYVARAWVTECDIEEARDKRTSLPDRPDLDVVAYEPGERPPAESKQAFCVLAKSSLASVALVTPYRTDGSCGWVRLEVGKTVLTDVTM